MPTPTLPVAFSPESLQKAVQEALMNDPAIPPGHRGAFVTVTGPTGVKAVIATKLNDHWTVTGEVDHPWTGGLTYGATVKATW